MSRIRICFVAQGAYPIASGRDFGVVGGAELQQVILAKALARKGLDVSMVSFDYGQAEGEVVDGVRFFKTYRLDEGMRYVRFLYPRLARIRGALVKADADVYYQRCAGFITGVTAYFCRRYHRRFIFAGAHEDDFMPWKQALTNLRDGLFYRYGLPRADAVFAQTETQKELLRRNYGIEGAVIPNCIEPVALEPSRHRDAILWVGTMRSWKRPRLFLDLAGMLPSYRFVMVGGRASGEGRLYEELQAEAKGIGNLDFRGFVPYHEIGPYFDRAALLVNTSIREGFPNTFLQAWIRGVPVGTLFDPDGVVKIHGLGVARQTIGDLSEGIGGILAEPELMDRVGGRCLRYVRQRHGVEEVVGKVMRAVEELMNPQYGPM